MLSRVQTQIHTEGELHMLARQNFFILLDSITTLYREKTVPECKKQTNKQTNIMKLLTGETFDSVFWGYLNWHKSTIIWIFNLLFKRLERSLMPS